MVNWPGPCSGHGATEALVKVWTSATGPPALKRPYYMLRVEGDIDELFRMSASQGGWRVEGSPKWDIFPLPGALQTSAKSSNMWADGGAAGARHEMCIGGKDENGQHYACACA